MTDAHLSTLFELLAQAKDKGYIGEAVSQLEHALQAAELGRLAGADTHCILAALFHDIGHLLDPYPDQMGGYGTANHEKIGANYMRQLGFSQKTAYLIESHVNAKRYLTWRDRAYLEKLSPASLMTLSFQGGPMTEAEALTFESHPYFKESLQVRAWDEGAKRINWVVPDLKTYLVMAQTMLEESHQA